MITAFLTALREFLGVPAAGYEPLEYLVAGCVLMFLIGSAMSVFGSILLKGGRRE